MIERTRPTNVSFYFYIIFKPTSFNHAVGCTSWISVRKIGGNRIDKIRVGQRRNVGGLRGVESNCLMDRNIMTQQCV